MSFWKSNLPANRPFRSLQEEMNSFFEDWNRSALTATGDFMPKLEVNETERSVQVKAELPGLKEEDIHVSLQDNSLIISGEKRNEMKKEEKGIYRSEITYGSFYRMVPLAAQVDAEKVSASYKDGVLTVEMEKATADRAQGRKISIKKV